MATKQELIDALEHAHQKGWLGGMGGGGSNSNQSSNSMPGPGLGEKAVREFTGTMGASAKTVADWTGLLVNSSGKISDYTKVLGTNFDKAGAEGSKISGVIGTLGSGLNGVTNYVEKSVDNFRDLSTTGAGFNNSIVEMTEAQAKTRLNFDEFRRVIKNNSDGFSNLGGNVTKGAQVFAGFSQELLDSEAGRKLTELGYTTEEINQITASYMTTTRSRNLMEDSDRKLARESIVALATEMDAVSKITGKSREAQEKDLKKSQESGQIRAAIDLAIMKGGKNVEDAYAQMYTAAGKSGPAFQSLTNDIFAMGRPSKENLRLFSLAGGEATQLLMQARAAARSGREGSAKEAQELTDRAATAFAKQSKNESIMLQASEGKNADAIRLIESAKQNANSLNSLTTDLKGTLADRVKAEGFDPTSAEGQRKMAELRNAEIKSEQGRGDAITKGTIQLQNSLRDVSSGLISGLAKPLRDDGEVGKALKGFVKNLDATNVSPTMAGTRKATEAMVDKVGELILGGASGASYYKPAATEAAKSGVLEKGDLEFNKAFDTLQTMVQSQSNEGNIYRQQLQKLAEEKKLKPDEYLKQTLQSDTATIKQTINSLTTALQTTPGYTPPSRLKDVGGYNPRETPSSTGLAEGLLKELQKITVSGNIVDLAVQGAANIVLKGAIQNVPTVSPTVTPTPAPPAPAVAPTPTPAAPTVTPTPTPAAPTVAPVVAPDLPAPASRIPRRQTGSFGAVGKDIEDFGKGTLAMLHGKEGVITEKRLNSLLDQSQTSAMMKNMTNFRPESIKAIGDSIEKMMSEKFKNFETTKADTVESTILPTMPQSANSSFNSDVLAALNHLNKLMGQMLSVNEQINQSGRQQVRATKGLSGDLYRSA
jgi:hypothetical protein